MIAGSIEQGAAGVVGEVAEHQDVVLERLERFEDARQGAELAFVVGVPIAHVDAVGHVDKRHASGGFLGGGRGEGRHHGVQERQGDGGAHTFEECTALERLACHVRHGNFSPLRDWNGRLRTISKISVWNP